MRATFVGVLLAAACDGGATRRTAGAAGTSGAGTSEAKAIEAKATPPIATPPIAAPPIATPPIATPPSGPPPAPAAGPPPAGLVDLQRAVPGLRLAVGYATKDNFTGAPLPGYGAAGAWAHAELATALRAVDDALAPDDLGLLVFDAYRPKRATAAMVTWAKRTGREDLLRDGFIAARSQHNRGLAIDLTLVVRSTGAPLDMGGAWDAFVPESAAMRATGDALVHRKRLRAAMLAQHFVPHAGEWWHFSLPHAAAPSLDVPYTAAP